LTTTNSDPFRAAI